ncbi:MAG: globin domain-containing protein [Mariprofundaceae bacterium]
MDQPTEIQLQDRETVRNSIVTLGNRMNALSVSFYTHLFQIDHSQMQIFDGSAVTLNRKFINMMATLKSIRQLEKMVPAIESLTKRHLSYGMKPEHLDPFKQALLLSLSDQLGDLFTKEVKQAWENTFTEVAVIMRCAVRKNPEWSRMETESDDANKDTNLFEKIGGVEIVTNVHTRLYTVLFDHPWLGKFFYGKNREALINKQTNFMVAAFGGPNKYVGEPPALAHMHMLITEEMALEREKILRKSILDEGLNDDITQYWLKIDRSFWPAINKNSIDECVTKCFGQAPLTIEKPEDHNRH